MNFMSLAQKQGKDLGQLLVLQGVAHLYSFAAYEFINGSKYSW